MLWWKYESYDDSVLNSDAAQLFEITVAPSATAVFSAVSRSIRLFELASTRRMWQLGHAAETMSTSSEISSDQPEFATGNDVALPCSLTLRKQPLAVVHAAMP